ncbi:MAG: PLP-dependent aminotransferase family protein [Clostridia bacterium]|nr:PLP-dependent aminotransferase family protein [Clostridia bacterium]
MEYNFSRKLAELKPSAIREIFKSLTDPEIISFAAGNPAPESFPVDELAKISADIFANNSAAALQYSITEGYGPLREAVAARQKAKFNIGTAGDSTLIVSGGQQGIELACKVFCNEGDTIICENPSFIGSLNSFRSNGINVVGVELEADGINIRELEKALKQNPRTKLLYVIPTFQNPAGITTSIEKRREILRLAKKYNVVILEDNPYGELRFRGEDVPTLKSMDTEGRVIYCSSFSKILSAGMRVGFVIANEHIISKMAVGKQGEDVHTNIFFQMLCHRYMTEYDIDAHIEDIRSIYRHKCDLMLDCIERYVPRDIVTFTRPEGGLFIWGTVKDCDDVTPIVQRLIAKKVAVVPGSAFNCDTSKKSGSFRLNYSTPTDEQIIEGVKRLGSVFQELK